MSALASVEFQSNWLEILRSPFMQNALIGGSLVAVAAGLLGYFVITRQNAFAAHALAHIGFPGACPCPQSATKRVQALLKAEASALSGVHVPKVRPATTEPKPDRSTSMAAAGSASAPARHARAARAARLVVLLMGPPDEYIQLLVVSNCDSNG